MSPMTPDGTAGPVSRDQIISCKDGDKENLVFPGHLIHTLAIRVTIHTLHLHTLQVLYLVLSPSFKENLNASRPFEHPPVRKKKTPKVIFRWDHARVVF